MRICLYTETALPKLGGQELVVDALAREFVNLGHHVSVLAPYPRHGLELADESYPYIMRRHPRFYSTRWGVGCYRHFLWRHFRKKRFDVLHCHGLYPAGYLAALLKEKINVPFVLTSHGGDVRQGNIRHRRAIIKGRHELAVRKADRLIAISGFTREGFLRMGARPEKIVDIPNGVHLDEYSSAAARPDDLPVDIIPGNYFLFLGRLVHRKGVDLLLRALGQWPDIRTPLVIAGDGDESSALRQMAVELNLQSRVHFLGRVDGERKKWLLQNSLCAILPSRTWEAFPLTVLESYAAGRPMIASRIPGLMDVVRDDRTGILVAEDDPAELAAAMRRLGNDPALADRMGSNARAWSVDFAWPAVAERHVALYRELVGIASSKSR